MPEEYLVHYCSPTLAGLKTGSLFTCAYESRETMLEEVRDFNRRFRNRGLVLLAARFSENRALLYLFRPGRLKADLSREKAAAILQKCGYAAERGRTPLVTLFSRLRTWGDFPHEIGLFLSYPPEDVAGFMENNAENYKAAGLWKVYGDVETAEKTFRKYRKCTELLEKRIRTGCSLDMLTAPEQAPGKEG